MINAANLAVVLAVLAPLLAQEPVASADVRAGTATVRGRVTEKSSGAPIARASVIARVLPNGAATQATADAEGRFEIRSLRPGRYDIEASAGEFKATHVSSGRRGPAIELKPGEVMEHDIVLARALALSGRVLDAQGFPLANVGVTVRYADRRDAFAGMARQGTDDQGNFRVFGLWPGRYTVCADARVPPMFSGPPRAPTRPRPREDRFVETCYPSATGDQQPQVLELDAADLEGIVIDMQMRPTYRVSGVAMDSTGASPGPVSLGISRLERNGSSGNIRTMPSSDFVLSDIAPGRYQISAQVGGPGRPGDVRDLEFGFVVLDVSQDVEGLVIQMKKPARVRGTLAFDGPVPPRFRPEVLRVRPSLLASSHSAPVFAEAGPIAADLTFELENIFGPHVLTLEGLPPGMAVKRARYGGREITGTAVEFETDPRKTVDILVTTRVAEISGRVLDERGNPTNARIVAFPAARERWNPRNLVEVSAGKDGSFDLRNLAAGEYLLAALSSSDTNRLDLWRYESAASYERVAAAAQRITLVDHDRRVVDLPLTLFNLEPRR